MFYTYGTKCLKSTTISPMDTTAAKKVMQCRWILVAMFLDSADEVHISPIILRSLFKQLLKRSVTTTTSMLSHMDSGIVHHGQEGFRYPQKHSYGPSAKSLCLFKCLQKQTRAHIFVLSLNQNGMGNEALNATDWRVPPLLDAYIDNILSQVTIDYPTTSSRSFRFINFNR
jgi:hypothetical protein